MKKLIFGAAIFLCCNIPLRAQNNENAVPRFSLSLNPLGFVQFGPIVNAELGVTNNLVLNAHVRFPQLGALSYVIAADKDGLDSYSASAAGVGVLYFLGTRKNRMYVGGMFDYQVSNMVYAQGKSYQWSEEDKSTIFMFNIGYRFRFGSHLFLNTGAFLGTAFTSWNWDYKSKAVGLSDPDSRTGSDVTPFGMLEVTLGYGF
jgi:hypothetical protein